jgi:predicted dehydrogenase
VSRLRWGLLGTARINRLLIPALRASSRSELYAVASRDGARARAYAVEWDIPQAFPSYEALLASGVDVVYIPVPNSLHVPWTLRALESGKHVLCEKPLALTGGDVDRVAAAAAAHDRVVAEGFMYRHHAQTRRVLDLLGEGAIGAPTAILGMFTYTQRRSPDVRLDPALGGGALWDVGCYPVSFSNLVAGAPPASVSGTQEIGPTGVDEHFAGTVVYANGVVAQFQAGFRSAYQTFMRIVGTSGSLEVTRPFRPGSIEHLVLRQDDAVSLIEVSGHPIMTDQVADFEEAALGARPPLIPLGESRMLAQTLDVLHVAARTGSARPLQA